MSPPEDDIIKSLQNWFEAPERQHLHNLLRRYIDRAWQEEVVAQLEKLLDDGRKNEQKSS